MATSPKNFLYIKFKFFLLIWLNFFNFNSLHSVRKVYSFVAIMEERNERGRFVCLTYKIKDVPCSHYQLFKRQY